ncbi:tRNA dimethylallyltransferase-like [Ornithodoros turicata]|uniref:tRNA dimethylallyltransferase-like n=1 Tax=Ornithodoros turicata TaxID=34597 RepID=UPI0031399AB7
MTSCSKMAATSALKSLRSLPYIVVLGATGTGKSKLAIEIASAFNGEIISADSMQVYKSLDITTNKVTASERAAVPHHMLDFLDPLSSFTVVDFRNGALQVIKNLTNQGKLPVIVGGTNYYIESLLWSVLVNPEALPQDQLASQRNEISVSKIINSFLTHNDCINQADEASLKSFLSRAGQNKSSELSTEDLYECLKLVDPLRAGKIHPKDRRKIERSLQVYQTHMQPHSKFIEEQQTLCGGSSLGGPLRNPRTCILWLQCDQKVLDDRLDSRVDDMIAQGLLKEMQDFHSDYNANRIANNVKPDYTTGIFQSIGFKEFHRYLMMKEEDQKSEAGEKLFKECLWLMKQVTKRYSRYQKKWIMRRFLGTPDRDVPPLYGLEATDVLQWDENVKKPALAIVQDYLEGREPIHAPLPSIGGNENVHKLFTCDVCNVTTLGSIVWQTHLQSRKHYKMTKRLREQQQAANMSTALESTSDAPES